MGIGNFFKGIAAQVIPGGKTYGSYNPPKKKLQPGDPGYVAPIQKAPVQNQQNNSLTVQQPKNVFSTGITAPTLSGAPKPTVTPLGGNTDLSPLLKPQPGQVIKPTNTIVPTAQHASNTEVPDGYQQAQNVSGIRTKQNGQTGIMATNKVTGQPHFIPDAPKPQSNSAGAKIGRFFGGAKDLAVGTVSNIPEVGLAAGRAATGIVGGVTQIPHIATAGVATATKAIANHTDNAVTRGINRGAQDLNTGTKNVTTVINKPLDAVNRGLDSAAKGYEAAVPTAYGGQNAYHATQVPINVLAALLTGGGSAAGDAGEGANAASKLAFLTKYLNKPLTSNADNVVAKTAQAISSKTAPVVKVLNTPISSTKSGVTSLLNRQNPNVVNVERGLVDAGEGGQVMNGVEDLTRPPTQIQVQQPTPIEVQGVPGEPVNVPVTNNTPTGAPIREFPGDSTPGSVRMPTPAEVEAQRAHDNYTAQPAGRPDQTVSGINDAKNVVTTADKKEYQSVLDDKLATGKLTTDEHKNLSDQLDKVPAQDAPVPAGRKITVKQVNPIDVASHTDVPTGLPETPGTVRATVATAPAKDASEAVANAPTVTTPSPISKETQDVLDNPKQYNKVQVKAARNQAKLAKAKAKADEATAEALARSDAAKPTGERGFVPSNELRKGRNGNISEVAHKHLEAAQGAHDTANLSADDVLRQAKDDLNNNGIHSPDTVRNLKALRDSGKFKRDSPEFKAVNEEYKSAISNHARALSMTDRAARTSASGDQLANRFTSKLLSFTEDASKIKDSHIQSVTEAENAFTDARDTAIQLGERFKSSGSDTDFKAWRTAQKNAESLDRQAKMTEFNVSKEVLKGNKSVEASQAIREAEKNAGVYSMDSIDANMLSGTGTMVRNYVNTLLPRAENKLFGRLTTRLVKPIATVGGSSGKGARIGASIGRDTYKADMAARKEAGVGRIRRVVTAGNTVGESNIEATTYSKAFDHYKQVLSKEGYKGSELNNRAEYNVHTDPDKIVEQYRSDVLQSNALSGLTHNTKKIENWLSDNVQQKLADAGVGAKGQQAGRLAAKAVTRVGVGFPTVVARSLVEGLKRATLGIPEAGVAAVKFANTGNKEAFAGELSKAMQHAGSGGSLMLLGHALGKAGVISGAYPSDPAERAKWTAEGRQENSIKIGGQWFSIPGYLGGFALPLMLGATTGSGNIKDEASFKNAWSTVLSASPVDNIQSTLDIVSGNGTDAKVKNAVTSLVRSGTPAGAFVAEIAKMTDSTQNDTTKKSAIQNILDSVAGGIPGLNNKVNTTDKTDDYGNVLHNPNPVALALGAQGSEQHQGTESVNQEQDASDQVMQTLSNNGVTGNKSLMQLVDPKIAKEIQSGSKLTPDEVAKVQKSVTKGITASEDSNWRESGDYSTDKAALQTKLDLLNADPTTKPSEKQAYKDQITRDDVLSQNKIPYDQLKLYQSTSLSDWRAMGDDQSDSYDPDTYQKLFDIDNAFTSSGVSYNKTGGTKNKFSAKAVKSGSGSKSSGGTNGDFGKLKAGVGAPTVQNYESLDSASGQIPLIQVQRPNIVHKISSSG